MTSLSDWHVRAARRDDLEELKSLAALTGGGFTNLPDDREALARRLDWSAQSLAADIAEPGDEFYMLMLASRTTGRIGGTACLFGKVGIRWPFYSYRLTTISLHSRELNRTFRTGVLHLVNDFDGASEVGGLFLHPELRSGGLGRLLARSRYLFLARHRARFTDRIFAELRGWLDPQGGSPFWDALAGRFFGMSFQEADAFNAIHGNQFIADLMPKYPVYLALLPDSAQAVVGRPHDAGRAAFAMLEREGFRANGYVDIFDGGPTVDARVSDLVAVRDAASARIAARAADAGAAETRLIAAGTLADFRCAALAAEVAGETLAVADGSPFEPGEEVLHVRF